MTNKTNKIIKVGFILLSGLLFILFPISSIIPFAIGFGIGCFFDEIKEKIKKFINKY